MSYSATAHDRYFEQMENEYLAQFDDEEEDDYEPEALEPEEGERDRAFEDEDERKLKLAEMEESCAQKQSNTQTAQSILAS